MLCQDFKLILYICMYICIYTHKDKWQLSVRAPWTFNNRLDTSMMDGSIKIKL
jgi:hypothetical protein